MWDVLLAKVNWEQISQSMENKYLNGESFVLKKKKLWIYHASVREIILEARWSERVLPMCWLIDVYCELKGQIFDSHHGQLIDLIPCIRLTYSRFSLCFA